MKFHKKPTYFIESFFVDKKGQFIFVEGIENVFKKFNLNSQKQVIEYESLNVGMIQSISYYEGLLCVGGMKGFSLIDICQKKLLVLKSIKIPVLEVFSSQFCVILHEEEFKVALSVSGCNIMSIKLIYS